MVCFPFGFPFTPDQKRSMILGNTKAAQVARISRYKPCIWLQARRVVQKQIALSLSLSCTRSGSPFACESIFNIVPICVYMKYIHIYKYIHTYMYTYVSLRQAWSTSYMSAQKPPCARISLFASALRTGICRLGQILLSQRLSSNAQPSPNFSRD